MAVPDLQGPSPRDPDVDVVDAVAAMSPVAVGVDVPVRTGVITAQSLSRVFALMRPNDLVWNSWVNNYLLGRDPPVFDILAWNADGTNLPATRHEQFLAIFADNTLATPGGTTVLGTPVDLSRITVPTYVTGAVNDHLTPWQGPGNPKASYFTSEDAPGPDPDAWRAGASRRTGSWWEHGVDWTIARSGTERAAPTRSGGPTHPVLDPAPGRHVRDRAA